MAGKEMRGEVEGVLTEFLVAFQSEVPGSHGLCPRVSGDALVSS